MAGFRDILTPFSYDWAGYARYTYGLILILFLSNLTIGQTPALKFRAISPSYLEEANPEHIFFSRSGKMWFGSSRGLASFDGSQVTYYNEPDDAALFGNTLISSMAEDKQGNFWIGTHQKGINFFESRTGKFHKIQLLLKGDSIDRTKYIQHVFIESDSSIWIATTALGFFIHNPLTHATRHFNLDISRPDSWQSRSRNTPNYFARDPHDSRKIWIGAYDGIYSCDREGENLKREFKVPTRVKETEGLPSSFCRIQKVDLPGNDTIWFSTWDNGMGYCDIKTGNTELFPQNKNEINPRARRLVIESFCPKSGHEYYVALRNYLPAIFNTHTRQYSFLNDYEMNKTIPYTYRVVVDDDNNLWICKGGGVFLHSKIHQVFSEADMSFQDIPDVRANVMRDIIWDGDTKAYYTAMDFSSGIHMLDSQMRRIKIIKMPLNPPGSANTEASLWKIIKDGSGRLWALGDIFSVLLRGATSFEPAIKLFPGSAFLNQTFRAADKDENSNLLLLGSDKVYIVYHNDLRADSIVFDNSFNAPTLEIDPQLQFDKKRRLLYASGSKAIYQYDLQKKQLKKLVYDKSQNNSLPYHAVSSFLLDGYGNLWVSSSLHGIRIYEPSGLQVIRELTLENSGIPSNAELRSAGSGSMLVETNIGLFLYDINKNSYLKLNR
ncbi:MAG TPA: two-component regulator propeller domain-containing protein, partial [Chitinophagaceae bacterium]|nr:two-component regulator propeller domain-containing protein [Chitinophagaceae bacterium]